MGKMTEYELFVCTAMLVANYAGKMVEISVDGQKVYGGNGTSICTIYIAKSSVKVAHAALTVALETAHMLDVPDLV